MLCIDRSQRDGIVADRHLIGRRAELGLHTLGPGDGIVLQGGIRRAGDGQVEALLIDLHSLAGIRAEVAVHCAAEHLQIRQRLLQHRHRGACPALRHRGEGAGRGVGRKHAVPHGVVHLAVLLQSAGSQEGVHSRLGGRAELAVRGRAGIAQRPQPVLQQRDQVALFALGEVDGRGRQRGALGPPHVGVIGHLVPGETPVQQPLAQRVVFRGALEYLAGGSSGAVLRDPLGVLHPQPDAAVGGLGAQCLRGGLRGAHLLGGVQHRMEQDAPHHPRGPLGIAVEFREVVPLLALNAVGRGQRIRAHGRGRGVLTRGADHLPHDARIRNVVAVIHGDHLVGDVHLNIIPTLSPGQARRQRRRQHAQQCQQAQKSL